MSHTTRLFRVWADNREEAVYEVEHYLDDVTETAYSYGIDYGGPIGGVCPDGTVFSLVESDAKLSTEALTKKFSVSEYVQYVEKNLKSYKQAKERVLTLLSNLPDDKHDRTGEYYLKNAVADLTQATLSGKINPETDFIFEDDLSTCGISEVYQNEVPHSKDKLYFIFADCHS